ncbi:hypothetical protein SAMN04487910_4329 [Aquimarina amphilecti]|uniref:Lipoprotein n=1 Tax=Aquimarina amphilecti TaxID=1038014 RepID=A0A1H7W7W7_AQUAM|nr:hypothetical protein [Aquimarina amphilecti]SEM17682.1 hypothetical protein SAMN04487910_4329 [Aquimarina amphilecti]
MKRLILISLLLTLGYSSCFDSSSSMSNSNKLDSDDYNSKSERVTILKNEIKSFSDFENAAFELFNVNGFSNSRTTLPGASSWDYKFVIKINPSDVDKWTVGMVEAISQYHEDAWMKKIIEKTELEWQTFTEPEIYSRPGDNVLMVVYRSEGIIYKRVISL